MDRQVQVGDRTTRFHLASPDGQPGAGILVFHPWWGLNDDVVAFADRLAVAGFTVAAPDLYGGPVATTIAEAERLSGSIDELAADAYALAAADYLVAMLGHPTSRIGTVGFSMGGAWALWLGAQRSDIGASVVYYGSIEGPSLAGARAPVLGHFAETDPYEPDASVTAFGHALRSAGRTADLYRYPGTRHWFAEASRPEYDPAAAELAFTRTVAFLRRSLVDGDHDS